MLILVFLGHFMSFRVHLRWVRKIKSARNFSISRVSDLWISIVRLVVLICLVYKTKNQFLQIKREISNEKIDPIDPMNIDPIDPWRSISYLTILLYSLPNIPSLKKYMSTEIVRSPSNSIISVGPPKSRSLSNPRTQTSWLTIDGILDYRSSVIPSYPRWTWNL